MQCDIELKRPIVLTPTEISTAALCRLSNLFIFNDFRSNSYSQAGFDPFRIMKFMLQEKKTENEGIEGTQLRLNQDT